MRFLLHFRTEVIIAMAKHAQSIPNMKTIAAIDELERGEGDIVRSSTRQLFDELVKAGRSRTKRSSLK